MNVIFNEIIIIDEANKLAKHQAFSKGINVISSKNVQNGNYVGKSTILKSLFHCLGAEAIFDSSKNWEKNWKYIYILKFSVDNDSYSILRHGSSFYVYKDNQVIFHTTERIKLSEFYVKLFGFSILLKDNSKNKEYALAQPFAYFVLNFVDQSGYKGCSFNSFNNISQYSDIFKDIIHAHMGIDSKKTYDLNISLQKCSAELAMAEEEKKVYRKILDTLVLEENVSFESLESIKSELALHQHEYSNLVSQYDKYKSSLIELSNQKALILSEIKKLKESVSANEEQGKKILNKHSCPLCKNEITNYTEVFFKKVKMNDNINYQLLSFNEELESINKEIEKYYLLYSTIENKINSIQSEISTKNNDVDSIMKNFGLKKYRDNMSEKYSKILLDYDKLTDDFDKIKKEFDSLNKMSDKINKTYSVVMEDLISKNHISVLTYNGEKIDAKLTCSDKHILTVLWLVALNKVKNIENKKGTFFPIVFDNPTDRDFDKKNEDMVFNMIFENINSDNQIIVSKVDFDVSEYKKFSINKIELDNKQYELLTNNDYEYCEKEFEKLSLSI